MLGDGICEGERERGKGKGVLVVMVMVMVGGWEWGFPGRANRVAWLRFRIEKRISNSEWNDWSISAIFMLSSDSYGRRGHMNSCT